MTVSNSWRISVIRGDVSFVEVFDGDPKGVGVVANAALALTPFISVSIERANQGVP